MKIWMTFMAGPGSLEDIKELWEPLRNLNIFDGLSVTYHGSVTDPEAEYLESSKGHGKIVYLPYSGRHDHSRNTYLWCGPISQGDWVFHTDTLERPAPAFCEMLKVFISNLKSQKINSVFFFGKPLLFEYHESMEFLGTPHEGLKRHDGLMRSIELSQLNPKEEDIRANVRPLKRKDPFGWVNHYARYYIELPWGSNHCLLGNEKRGDPIKLFEERENIRIAVREYLRVRGPVTVQALKEILTNGPIDDTLKSYINAERILNDFYRFWVLGDQSVKDDHTWSGMIKI